MTQNRCLYILTSVKKCNLQSGIIWQKRCKCDSQQKRKKSCPFGQQVDGLLGQYVPLNNYKSLIHPAPMLIHKHTIGVIIQYHHVDISDAGQPSQPAGENVPTCLECAV